MTGASTDRRHSRSSRAQSRDASPHARGRASTSLGTNGVLLGLATLALLAQPADARRRREPAPIPPNEGGLVDNVNGYTLDKDGRLLRFTGLLVDKQGKVARLLQGGDKRPERLDFRLDGRGRTLLPGLIDAHGHVMGLGERVRSLDLSGTTSLADAQTRLAAWAQAHPTPVWIRGGGWNQEQWRLGRFPTALDLDQAVRDRPVVLERIDGHALLVNSVVLREIGVTPSTKDPAGGRIERDPKGVATGLFVDAAMDLVTRVVPKTLPRERDQAFQAAQDALLAVGVTATADMGTSADDWNVFRRAGDADRLRVRILSYALGLDPLLSVAGTGPTPWLYGGRLRMVGVKLYDDGALGSRGAWLKRPYADAPGDRGLRFQGDTQLRNLMSRAAMDGFQVAVHAIGDAANDQVLGAIEEVAETYKGDRRWRIEHAQIVDPADLPRFGRNGIVASMQPTHQSSDWQMAEARLGPDRLTGAYAWKAMLDAGARIAFGSDYPVEKPEPLVGIAVAMSREDASGRPPGGWQPQQRVTFLQALAGFTTGAAYAGFAEDRIGSLTPGHEADFVLLGTDPAQATPAQLRTIRVEETWIAGKRMWARK